MRWIIWTFIKLYFWPIISWLFKKGYKENFDLKILSEKYEQNRSAIRKKLLKHTLKTTKIAIEKFEIMQKEVESIPWYAWTIVEEDSGWGSLEPYYYWQELPKKLDIIRAYDQREHSDLIGNVWCFVYWNINNAAMNLNIELDSVLTRRLVQKAIKIPSYRAWWGGNFLEWADVVDELLNEIWVEFQRMKLSTLSSNLFKALEQGYAITMPIHISNELRDWLFDDGKLSADEMVWNTVFWHLMNIKMNLDKKIVMWIDNYPSTMTQYIFEIEELGALIRSGKFMNIARLYVPIKDVVIEEIIEPIPLITPVTPVIETIDVWDKSDYQKYLDRGFIERPQPDRILTERLYWTLREREIQQLDK